MTWPVTDPLDTGAVPRPVQPVQTDRSHGFSPGATDQQACVRSVMPPVEDRNDRERARALEMAVGQIEKQFGKGSIMRLGQKDAITVIPSISTGAVSLDYALGIGGVPRGRVVEIFG